MDIRDKVAVVTGAASGIGRATALAFAEASASVVVCDVDDAGGAETVALVEKAGADALFVAADVTRPEAVGALYDRAEERFGGVDIVHNNAGLVCGEPLWPDIAPARMLAVIATNLGGVCVGTRMAVEPLARRGGGAIVNTASMAALFPLAEDPVYSATKAGVVMFTQACVPLAASHGIRVNAVCPFLVDTPMLSKTGDGEHPAGWVGQAESLLGLLSPEEVAEAVLDLVRDETAVGEHRTVGRGSAPLPST